MTQFLDTTADGVYDTLLLDSNSDGRYDCAAYDLDQNGAVEAIVLDVNGDADIEIWAFDDDQNGQFERAAVDLVNDGAADVSYVDTNGDGWFDVPSTVPSTEVDLDTYIWGPGGASVGGSWTSSNGELMETLTRFSGQATFGSPDYDHDRVPDYRDVAPTDPSTY